MPNDENLDLPGKDQIEKIESFQAASIEADIEIQRKIDNYNDGRALKDEVIRLMAWFIKVGIPLLFGLILGYCVYLINVGKDDVVTDWIERSVAFVIGVIIAPYLRSLLKEN